MKLSELSRRQLYGTAVTVFGLIVAIYFFLVVEGAIEPQGSVTDTRDSAGFIGFVGIWVAVAGSGHIARLGDDDMEFLYMFSGGVLVLFHTIVLVGDPLSLSTAKGAYRYPPLYGTIIAVSAILLAMYLRYSDDS